MRGKFLALCGVSLNNAAMPNSGRVRLHNMSNPVLKTVAVKDLHFDPENPRLPEKLKHQNDDKVLEYLLLECNLIELMMSIGEKDYFAGEPLMVVPEQEWGGFTVVEGNRRLGALKLLASNDDPPVLVSQVAQIRKTAKFRPTDVPVLEFGKRDEILTYLGYRHITGIKEWDALAKARYLVQLRAMHATDHETAHKALAKEIGSKSTHVAKLLTGHALLKKAGDLGILSRLKLEEDDIPFSLLTTGIGWENVAHFIGLRGATDVELQDVKPEELEELFKWVFDKSQRPYTVLGDSRNFAKLARVVANETALSALRRGDPLDTADLLTSGPLEAVRQHIGIAENSIKLALETLNVTEGLQAEDVGQAERLRKAAVSLHSTIREFVENRDDA